MGSPLLYHHKAGKPQRVTRVIWVYSIQNSGELSAHLQPTPGAVCSRIKFSQAEIKHEKKDQPVNITYILSQLRLLLCDKAIVKQRHLLN